jgi:hypothetical protein
LAVTYGTGLAHHQILKKRAVNLYRWEQ